MHSVHVFRLFLDFLYAAAPAKSKSVPSGMAAFLVACVCAVPFLTPSSTSSQENHAFASPSTSSASPITGMPEKIPAGDKANRREQFDARIPDILLTLMMNRRIYNVLEPIDHGPRGYEMQVREMSAIARENGAAIVPTGLDLIRRRKELHLALHMLRSLKTNAREAIPLLIAALDDDDDFVRYGAADALSHVARPTPSALFALLRHEDPGIRQAAVMAVVGTRLHGFGNLPELHRLLEDSDRGVRLLLVNYGHFLRDGPLTARIFLERLDQEETIVQRSMLRVFRHLDMRPHMGRLLHYARHDDGSVREAAMGAVGRGTRFSDAGLRILIAALDDEDLDVRAAATSELTRYKRPLSPALIAILVRNAEQGNDSMAINSVHLLVPIKSPSALGALRKLKRSKFISTRSAAVQGLRRLGASKSGLEN